MDIKSQIIEIVKAQASIRAMSLQEISDMIDQLTNKVESIPESEEPKQCTLIEGVDYAVCLECGAKVKSIVNHITHKHRMRVIEYRVKHGLAEKYIEPERSRKPGAHRKKTEK